QIRLPELGLGLLITMGGMPRLVREVGMAKARDAILTARPLTLDEARDWGIVHRVGESRAEVARLVEELLRTPAPVQSMAEQALHAIGRSVVSLDTMWSQGDLLTLTWLEPELQDHQAEGRSTRGGTAATPTTQD